LNKKSIKLQRTESILKEVLSEAIATLNDGMLKSLVVTDVDCKRGKYDADVLLDQTLLNDEDKEYIKKHLKKVKPYLENYVLQNEGWFKCPKLHFKFDDKLQKKEKMDMLFSKISKELKGRDD